MSQPSNVGRSESWSEGLEATATVGPSRRTRPMAERFRVSWLTSKHGRLMIGGRPMGRKEADSVAESLRSQGCDDVRVTPAGSSAALGDSNQP